MRTKKAFAIAVALLMMLAVFTVVGTTSVSAQETTVVLKKPIEGEKWLQGGYYKVLWAFPSGDLSQIISIDIACNPWLSVPWWSWEASMYSVDKVPTSCTVRVPAAEIFAPGIHNIRIEVRYYSQPGVEATATDYRTVTIVDNFPPTIWTSSQPQIFVLGVDAVTTAAFDEMDSGSGIDLGSMRVTVDGKPVPAEKVALSFDLAHMAREMQLKTDWLSLGKHKVTFSVADNAGNVAKASWVVQVVRA